MKKFIVLCSLLLVFMMSGLGAKAGLLDSLDMEAAYQHDMDITRLNDLKEIGGYIEEFKAKTGNYPFIGVVDVPLYAQIATKDQEEIIKNSKGPPYEYKTVYAADFIKVLERGLGRKIVMPFDPQQKPSGRQNFYTYMAVKDQYFFAVHLYNEYSFAQKIGDNWYKVEISNKPQPNPLTWDYKALVTNSDFQKAIVEPLTKPGYVEQLRDKIRAEGGF